MGRATRKHARASRLARFATVAAVCLFAAATAPAVTWRVERDGSGHFTTIQPATAAASPGDTILLGPGHYTEYTPFDGSGTLLNYYVFLEDDDVTLLGVDRGVVTIGPVQSSGFDPVAVGFINALPSARIAVEGVTFAHCRSGIVTNETHVTVRNCRFYSNDVGLNSNATASVLVEDCEFLENTSRGVLQFDAAATPLLIVRNCQFTDNSYAIDSQEESNIVEDCNFTNNRVGVQFSARGIGSINRNTFTENYVGIGLTSQSVAEVQGNEISGGSENMVLVNGSHATGSENILGGGAYSTMTFYGQATAALHGNHLLHLSGIPAIRVNSGAGSGHTIDLRNNFWNSSSALEIAAAILDSQDNPQITGTVLFEPFLEEPVATRRATFGQLKHLFGGRD